MLSYGGDDLLPWETREGDPSWSKAYANSTLMRYYKPREWSSNNFRLINTISLGDRHTATPQAQTFLWLAIRRRKGNTCACIQICLKQILKMFDFCVYYLLVILLTTNKKVENNISFGIGLVSFVFVSNSHCLHYKRQQSFFWMPHNTALPASSSRCNTWEFPYSFQWEVWAISTSEY